MGSEMCIRDRDDRSRSMGWAGGDEQYLYEPLEGTVEIDQAIHWALSRENIFINTVGDVDLLPHVLDAASRFVDPLDAGAIKDLLSSARLSSLFGIGT